MNLCHGYVSHNLSTDELNIRTQISSLIQSLYIYTSMHPAPAVLLGCSIAMSITVTHTIAAATALALCFFSLEASQRQPADWLRLASGQHI